MGVRLVPNKHIFKKKVIEAIFIGRCFWIMHTVGLMYIRTN